MADATVDNPLGVLETLMPALDPLGVSAEPPFQTLNRFISQKTRDDMDESDFAGPDRSFPIKTQEDVVAAVHSIGRSKHDPAVIKAGIKRIAKRKGFKLPDAWEKEGDGGGMDQNCTVVSHPQGSGGGMGHNDDMTSAPSDSGGGMGMNIGNAPAEQNGTFETPAPQTKADLTKTHTEAGKGPPTANTWRDAARRAAAAVRAGHHLHGEAGTLGAAANHMTAVSAYGGFPGHAETAEAHDLAAKGYHAEGNAGMAAAHEASAAAHRAGAALTEKSTVGQFRAAGNAFEAAGRAHAAAGASTAANHHYTHATGMDHRAGAKVAGKANFAALVGAGKGVRNATEKGLDATASPLNRAPLTRGAPAMGGLTTPTAGDHDQAEALTEKAAKSNLPADHSAASQKHRAAAAYHLGAAADHDAACGGGVMNSAGRAEAIDYLIANSCGCWTEEDRPLLGTMSDARLSGLMANAEQHSKDAPVLAALRGAGVVVNGVHLRLGDDDQLTGEYSNADGSRPAFKDLLLNYGTPQEQEAWNASLQVFQEARQALVDRLVANAAPAQRLAAADVYSKMEMGDLRKLAEAVPQRNPAKPAPGAVAPRPGKPAAPNYAVAGAGTGAVVGNAAPVEDARERPLGLPRMVFPNPMQKK